MRCARLHSRNRKLRRPGSPRRSQHRICSCRLRIAGSNGGCLRRRQGCMSRGNAAAPAPRLRL
jgi:hypothetical protein